MARSGGSLHDDESRGQLLPVVGRVAILEVDPELGERLDSRAFEEAKRACVAPVLPVGRGPLATSALEPAVAAASMGFLVLTGQLVERHSIGGRQSADLLLPGDPGRPWPSGPDYTDLVAETSWWVAEAGALALLDRTFAARCAGWPELLAALSARWRRRVHSLSLKLAIAQMPRLDERLHLLLWCLGDRLGVVRPEGLAVPLEITDRALGELVGAQREPVSRALRLLRDSGRVERLPAGGFLLKGPPPIGTDDYADQAVPTLRPESP